MNNQNDYSEFIAFLFALLALFFMYYLKDKLMDYYFYYWYYTRMPVFEGLGMVTTEEIRAMLVKPLELFMKNPSAIINGAVDLFQQNNFQEFFNLEKRDAYVTAVNKLTPYLLLPLSVPLVYIISKKIQNKKRFKKVFSIESLGVQESKIWPQIQPVIYDYKNFVNAKSLDEGWFAMSPKPINYFKDNDLLYYYKNEDEDDIDNYGQTRFKIKVEKMHEFFVKEMGKPWSGIEDMSIEKKCILAIILPKLLREKSGKKDLSKLMNDKLARAYAGARPIKKGKATIEDPKHKKEIMKLRAEVHKEVEELLNKYFPPKTIKEKKFGLISKEKVNDKKVHPLIESIIEKHFYEKVIFSVFLEEARKTGVLASCEFLWLKKHDRDLWYIMSQTGRTASFCECAGAWSHLLTEKKVGRKIATPMVQKAIDAADKYLFETHDNYDPIGDYEED